MPSDGGLRVVLIHDWLTGMRGGEKCLEPACRRWTDAPLYTLFHRPGSVSPAIADTPPATFVGLVNGNALVQFQEDTPTQLDSLVLISGLASGEVVMSIDGRPGTGQLLALAVSPTGGATDGKLYWVDPDTGAATPTGTPTSPPGRS